MSIPMTQAGITARPRRNLSKELEDALDVPLRRFSVGRDFPPLGVGHQPVHQLCYPPRVDIVVARHDQGRCPDTLEHLYRRPQGRIGAIEKSINRVPHDLGILLRRHDPKVLSKPRIVLDALGDKWRKAVIPATTAFIPWVRAMSMLLYSFVARYASQITPPARLDGK